MQTPPHSRPPPDVEWHGELLVTCPFGTTDLSATSLPPGTGNGLQGLMPRDFPDPHRQKWRRFLCFAILYSVFMIDHVALIFFF